MAEERIYATRTPQTSSYRSAGIEAAVLLSSFNTYIAVLLLDGCPMANVQIIVQSGPLKQSCTGTTE